MDYKNKLDLLINHASGKAIDVFYEFFLIISAQKKEDQGRALEYLCESVNRSGDDGEYDLPVKRHYTEEQASRMMAKIEDEFVEEAEQLVLDSSKNSVPPEEMYQDLWTLISSNRICKNKHEKALAIFVLMNNDIVPYRAVGTGISMENEKFSSIVQEIGEDLIADAEMILKIQYEQKTQRASLLIERLNSLKNPEEQSVYLSIVLETLRKNIKKAIKEKIEEVNT